MVEKISLKNKPDPVRIQILRMLPPEIKDSLSPEEIKAILFEDVWPDSLEEKLRDYVIEE
jgi:hypothetical protein